MRAIRFLLALALLVGTAVPVDAEARPKRFEFEQDFVIEGEVQKPEVTVVISRENLNKGYNLSLKESFLPKIVEALEKEPF